MLGVVVVTHGDIATALIAATEHIFGPQAQMLAVPIGPEDNVADRHADLASAVRAADSGEGVIILTDMFGGTPSNLAIAVMAETRSEVVAGVNLPMLVKLTEVRGRLGLNEAAAAACEAARHYIRVVSAELDAGP